MHTVGVSNAPIQALGLPRWPSGEEPTCQCRRGKRHRFNPGAGKIPWSRNWQPAPVFLPGKFRGKFRLQSMGSQRAQHSTHTRTHTHIKTFKSCPLEFYVGEFKGRHCFLEGETATIHLVGRVYQKLMKPIFLLLLRG